MPRYQYHLSVTAERWEHADPELIVILDAPSDAAGVDLIGELLPDVEWDMTDIRCDACGFVLDDCTCTFEFEKPCPTCRKELDLCACEMRRWDLRYLECSKENHLDLVQEALFRGLHVFCGSETRLAWATQDAMNLLSVEHLLEQTA